MDIRIKTTNYQMQSETSQYLDKKIADIEKFVDESEGAARCEVEVGRAAGHPERGNIWMAEVHLIYKGREYRSVATAESVNAAIDEAKDDIMRQLRRDKRFHIRIARRGGALLKRIIRFGDGG